MSLRSLVAKLGRPRVVGPPVHTGGAVVLATTVALLGGVGWHAWASYSQERTELERHRTFEAVLHRLVAESARHSAIVSALPNAADAAEAADGHARSAAGLAAALAEARSLAPDESARAAVTRMEGAGAQARALEARALRAAAEGSTAEARRVLGSPGYRLAAAEYGRAEAGLRAAVGAGRMRALAARQRRALTLLGLSLLSVPVVAFTWYCVLRRLKAYLLERRRAERALRESEERYRALFESHPQPVLVHDPDTLAILAVNGAAVEKYGYTRQEFLSLTLRDVREPLDVPAVEQQVDDLCRGSAGVQPSRHRTRSGEVLEVEVSGRTVQFGGRRARLSAVYDVTEHRRLEAHLHQSQKMEALGKLAGGVAHDFNNVLGVIIGHTDMGIRGLGPEDPRRRRFESIRQAAEHAADLTRRLLAFGRREARQARVVDANGVVADMESMLRPLIGEDVELATELAPNAGAVHADPAQLGQILMNLAVNARDAMPEGGRLTIRTARVRLDGRGAVALPEGDYVLLEVRDTGCGMTADVQQHVFEPFFTTKAKGKGSGLGLATVYAAVRQSGGAITVDTAPGRGAAFDIFLPAASEPAEARAAAGPASAPAPEGPVRGGETILLVEDEGPLRELAREALEAAGYRVLEAASATDALAMVAGGGSFDLLVTDVVMPRMNGRELACRLQQARPALKVLYVSGYAPAHVLDAGELRRPGVGFVAKPFRTSELTRRIRELLDARPQPDGA